jgi:hypothetical protein
MSVGGCTKEVGVLTIGIGMGVLIYYHGKVSSWSMVSIMGQGSTQEFLFWDTEPLVRFSLYLNRAPLIVISGTT